jgi:hypothetical protein
MVEREQRPRAADGGHSPAEAKGVYKGRLMDERVAAQAQVDKSFLKSGICAIPFQFTGFSSCCGVGGEEKGRMRTMGQVRNGANTT